MKKFKDLDKNITTLDGTLIAGLLKEKSMTYRSALIAICEMHKPLHPGTGESLKAFDLGMKIQRAKEELELEQDEIEFLKKIIDVSSIFLSVVAGRLVHFLNETGVEIAKDKKVEVEKK